MDRFIAGVVFAISAVAIAGLVVWLGSVLSAKRSYGLPSCPDPPPMPPVKPPREPRETWHFHAGMNHSTVAAAMKVEPLSLDAIYAACGGPPGETLTHAVVITTRQGFKLLVHNLPTHPKVARSSWCSIEPFYGVPTKKYDDEGMARAAAIVAEADGYEVMLFIPGSGQLPNDDEA